MKPDYSLYLVTDRMRMSTRTLGEAVEQAVIGGCTLVQLREKEIPALDFYMLALEIKKITDRYGIPLIIMTVSTLLWQREHAVYISGSGIFLRILPGK